jgi:hypothetical protein
MAFSGIHLSKYDSKACSSISHNGHIDDTVIILRTRDWSSMVPATGYTCMMVGRRLPWADLFHVAYAANIIRMDIQNVKDRCQL